MRILIADDDEIARELLQNALQEVGHEVVAATNGYEALEILRAGKIRMVISDWVMPEMTGLQLCQKIRCGTFPGYIYVILLTSRDRTEDIVEGLSAGADDFMVKPFQPAELRVRIRSGERVLSLETRDVAIFGMAKLAESRDPETGVHLERMREYCRIIAIHLSDSEKFRDLVDDEYVRTIYLTSPLHDIGKVGIPDSVLLKPGRLNDREFNIMKTHTLIGAETLAAAVLQYPGVAYLRMAHSTALTHHERYNGSGYPNGLAGLEIPLCGRIVALADVYDALTSKRVYKEAINHDVARSLIIAESGSHFDPDIVDAFIHTEEQFMATRAQFSDP